MDRAKGAWVALDHECLRSRHATWVWDTYGGDLDLQVDGTPLGWITFIRVGDSYSKLLVFHGDLYMRPVKFNGSKQSAMAALEHFINQRLKHASTEEVLWLLE